MYIIHIKCMYGKSENISLLEFQLDMEMNNIFVKKPNYPCLYTDISRT